MNAIEHLDALGGELATIGWSSAIRFDHKLLRVWHGSFPRFGESICVASGPGEQPWYQSSTGELIWPCDEPRRAARELVAGLTPYLPLVGPCIAEPRRRKRMRRFLALLSRPRGTSAP